eukprot:244245_1
MTISHIALDTWAAGKALQFTTITIVSLSLFISFSLFLIRLYQLLINTVTAFRKRITSHSSSNQLELASSTPSLRRMESLSKPVLCTTRLLQICHLLAMFWSCLYIFLYLINYLHLFISLNVNCTIWFISTLLCITMTKIFVYTFLMLRSSLAFKSSPLFRIPLSLSVTVVTFAVATQLLMMSLMISDFRIIVLDTSYCFRVLGPIGTIGICGFNIGDAASAVVALIIFWGKVKRVKSSLSMNNTTDTDALDDDGDRMAINQVFMKHITLGTLIVAGSLLMFLAGEFLTILMGVASTLHQSANNLYLFLLFKENNALYVSLASVFCCTNATKNMDETERKYKTINNKSDDSVVEMEGTTCLEDELDEDTVLVETQTRIK